MIIQEEKKSIPVALITGYLGAGKTTLLNELLKNPKGHKVAVIVNDIGEINIDASLIEKGGSVTQIDDSLVPLSNGCICCTLKNDLLDQIVSLSRMDKFDYIVIEASGICEPMPIAQNITMLSESAEQRGIPEICHLDNIISVVDAYRMAEEFECGVDFKEKREVYDQEEDIQSLLIQQIEFANITILNKAELVDENQKAQIKAVIKALCPDTKIIEANYGKVDVNELLDTDNFDFEKAYYSEGWVKALTEDEHEHEEEHEHEHEHDHEEEHDYEHHHEHEHHGHHHHHHHGEGEVLEYGIDTFVYSSKKPFSLDKLRAFTETWTSAIIRVKGYLWFEQDPSYLYVFEQAGKQIQVGRDSMWLAACEPQIQEREFKNHPEIKETWDEKYGDRENKIVFIGKNLDKEAIIESMDACTVDNFTEN